MSRSNWDVQIKSGGVWGSAGNLSRPNNDFVINKLSTQTKIGLADGNNAFITPSRKYNNEDLVYMWYYDDGTIKTLLEGYIESQNDLKITDDLSNIYYGRFVSVTINRTVGDDTAHYDVQAIFQRIPGLA